MKNRQGSSSSAAFRISVLTLCLVLVLSDDNDNDDDDNDDNDNDDDDDDDDRKKTEITQQIALSFCSYVFPFLVLYNDDDESRGDSTYTEGKTAFLYEEQTRFCIEYADELTIKHEQGVVGEPRQNTRQ